MTALSIAAILDVLIAGMLVYLLNQNKTGIKRCVALPCSGGYDYEVWTVRKHA